MAAGQARPTLPQPFRRATPADADDLARFIEHASEGLALYLWSKLAGPGEDPWRVGRERVLHGAVGLSYQNAIVAEHSGRSAAGLIGYALSDGPESRPDGLPQILLPLFELTDLALGSWYVHVLAAAPEQRGKGHGSALLALADRVAASAGKPGLSLIVSDTNAGARKLYERCGYRETANRKMIKEQWQHPGTNWILMRKSL